MTQKTNPLIAAGQGQNFCGPDTPDIPPIIVYRTIAHKNDNVKITLKSNLKRSSTIASLGLRDLSLSLYTSGEASLSDDQFCGVANWDLGRDDCSCGQGVRVYGGNSGFCLPCHADCQLCRTALSNGCLTVISLLDMVLITLFLGLVKTAQPLATVALEMRINAQVANQVTFFTALRAIQSVQNLYYRSKAEQRYTAKLHVPKLKTMLIGMVLVVQIVLFLLWIKV